MRRIVECVNCGEVRGMAAHNLCFRCYRRDERASDIKVPQVDRHNPGIRRDHKKLFRGFTNVMVGLSDLGVQRSDILRVRRMLQSYIGPIAQFLTLSPDSNESQFAVNSEHEPGSQFTVHSAPSSSVGQKG